MTKKIDVKLIVFLIFLTITASFWVFFSYAKSNNNLIEEKIVENENKKNIEIVVGDVMIDRYNRALSDVNDDLKRGRIKGEFFVEC